MSECLNYTTVIFQLPDDLSGTESLFTWNTNIVLSELHEYMNVWMSECLIKYGLHNHINIQVFECLIKSVLHNHINFWMSESLIKSVLHYHIHVWMSECLIKYGLHNYMNVWMSECLIKSGLPELHWVLCLEICTGCATRTGQCCG